MSDRKLVFVQVEDEHVQNVLELMGSLPETDYFFVVLPMSAKILAKRQVEQMLRNIKE